MAVNDLSVFFGKSQFLHHHIIIEQYTWPIHHLCKVYDVRSLQQFVYIVGANFCSCCFKACRRDTGRGSKVEFEWHGVPVVNHIFNTFHSKYISNFMRVRDGAHCAMAYCRHCEFRGGQHGAFYMDMGINKPW